MKKKIRKLAGYQDGGQTPEYEDIYGDIPSLVENYKGSQRVKKILTKSDRQKLRMLGFKVDDEGNVSETNFRKVSKYLPGIGTTYNLAGQGLAETMDVDKDIRQSIRQQRGQTLKNILFLNTIGAGAAANTLLPGSGEAVGNIVESGVDEASGILDETADDNMDVAQDDIGLSEADIDAIDMSKKKKLLMKSLKFNTPQVTPESTEEDLMLYGLKKGGAVNFKNLGAYKRWHMTHGGSAEVHKKPGGSNVGKYKGERTIGHLGDAPKGSYPVTKGGKLNEGRLRAAIAYARHAPNPEAIKARARSLLKNMKKANGGYIMDEYALGGIISGKGTAKSDSIKASVPEGSFVVPAENAHIAEMLRKHFLSKKKGKADLKEGGIPVKLSDGEHLFTPDEVKELTDAGIDLNELAPKAKNTLNLADGGKPKKALSDYSTEELQKLASEGKLTQKQFDELKKSLKFDTSQVTPESTEGDLELYGLKKGDVEKTTETTALAEIPKVTLEQEKPFERKKELPVNAADFLAAGQAGIAAYNLLRESKRPKYRISGDFLSDLEQAKKEAAFGFSPAERAYLNTKTEAQRRANIDRIVNFAGGDAGTALANIHQAQDLAQKNYLDIARASEELKRSKLGYKSGLIGRFESLKRTQFEDDMRAFDQNQMANAELLNAGLYNLFQNQTRKDALRMMRETKAKYGNELSSFNWQSVNPL